jgi:hypothetical protein
VSFWAEVFRLRSGHMSDRANVIPWSYVQIPLFIISIILFWVAAALRYRSGRRGAKIDEHYLSIRLSGN